MACTGGVSFPQKFGRQITFLGALQNVVFFRYQVPAVPAAVRQQLPGCKLGFHIVEDFVDQRSSGMPLLQLLRPFTCSSEAKIMPAGPLDRPARRTRARGP